MKDQKVLSVAAGDGYSLVLTKNGKNIVLHLETDFYAF